MDWVRALTAQLDFYWQSSLKPRLDGLTDEEFFWEPVEGCWSLRPGPDGAHRLDGADPEPSPPPVTTIAWRIVHIAVGVFHTRASAFFGDGRMPAGATMFDPRHEPERLPATAAEAVALLESSYRWWLDGVNGLSEEEFLRPLGPRGAFFADEPMAMLVLHLNRETFHHGGEIGTLRDLFRATGAASREDRLQVRGAV
jgi:hypothetical protein